MKTFIQPSRNAPAFTLIELLVSTAIIALLMLVLVAMTNQTTRTWQYTAEKIEKFQQARDGFESMTRRISQATLNTYWDYMGVIPPSTNYVPRPKDVSADPTSEYSKFVPKSYGRASELRFISGPMSSLVQNGSWLNHGIFFQAPLGMVEDTNNTSLNNLLNTWGYFVEVDDDFDRPDFLASLAVPPPPRWRSRLMEFMQPAEKMALYDTDIKDPTTQWFTVPLKISNASTTPKRPVRVLSENVVALIILPKLTKQDETDRTSRGYSPTLSPKFTYDSKLNLRAGDTGDLLYLNVGAKVNKASNIDPADLGGINPKNQLPPIVQVTMIAIDERSAARLQDRHLKSPTLGLDAAAKNLGLDLTTLFTDATRLEDNVGTTTPGDGDLYDYERILVSEKLTYRIFTTNVTIRGAKWSRATTK